MNKNTESKKKQLLEKMIGRLGNMDISAELETDESGNVMLVAELPDLSISGDGAVGCFYFLHVPETDAEDEIPDAAEAPVDVLHFITNITIRDEIDPLTASMLRESLSRLNYMMPFGSFVMPPDNGVLSFRHTQSLPAFLTEDQMLSFMVYQTVLALQAAGRWMDAVNDLADGAVSVPEFRKSIGE